MQRWVVKIGGSLHGSSCLPQVVRRAGDFPHSLLVVPGGGVFADQVRESQRQWRFSDRRAHAMALLAMSQYGHLLAALGDLDTTKQARDLPQDGATRVWLPDESSLEGELPATWDVTSDSVAAWLACRLKADWLVFVKPVAFDTADTAIKLLDAAFIDTVKASTALRQESPRFAMASAQQWLCEDFSCEACQFSLG